MKRAIVFAFLVLTAAKVVVAANLDLFGDEAFYWQSSQRPALSYADSPFMTAMLVRAGPRRHFVLLETRLREPLGTSFEHSECGLVGRERGGVLIKKGVRFNGQLIMGDMFGCKTKRCIEVGDCLGNGLTR